MIIEAVRSCKNCSRRFVIGDEDLDRERSYCISRRCEDAKIFDKTDPMGSS